MFEGFGNFQLSFTDLTIPVTSLPITVTRTYDLKCSLLWVRLGGVKQALSKARKVQGNPAGVDDVLATKLTKTKVDSCFVAGTEILTTEGIKNIEDIQVGDWVIADDPTTPGGIEARQVLETFVRETDTLIDG